MTPNELIMILVIFGLPILVVIALLKYNFQKIKNKGQGKAPHLRYTVKFVRHGVLCFFGWKFRTREIVRNFSEKSDCNLESSRL